MIYGGAEAFRGFSITGNRWVYDCCDLFYFFRFTVVENYQSTSKICF